MNKKNYCIDCGKEIDYRSTRCNSCARIGKSNCWKHKKGKPKCIDCGKLLSNYNHKRCIICSKIGKNNPNYGNHKLAGKNHPMFGIDRHGSKAANWQGGKSFEPYPLGWTNTFKEQIRYRDNYKCQLCGCPEIENGRKLSVHHIDYDKRNINPDNLISLCINCHMKTNAKTKRIEWTNFFREYQNGKII